MTLLFASFFAISCSTDKQESPVKNNTLAKKNNNNAPPSDLPHGSLMITNNTSFTMLFDLLCFPGRNIINGVEASYSIQNNSYNSHALLEQFQEITPLSDVTYNDFSTGTSVQAQYVSGSLNEYWSYYGTSGFVDFKKSGFANDHYRINYVTTSPPQLYVAWLYVRARFHGTIFDPNDPTVSQVISDGTIANNCTLIPGLTNFGDGSYGWELGDMSVDLPNFSEGNQHLKISYTITINPAGETHLKINQDFY